MRFQVGDTVKISKKPRLYGDRARNPKDMEGKVQRAVPNGHVIVQWDNGQEYYYEENNLRLVRRER